MVGYKSKCETEKNRWVFLYYAYTVLLHERVETLSHNDNSIFERKCILIGYPGIRECKIGFPHG